ncbi:hypothetical protein LCGC14_2731310 [marine sediment metagenome]|uniref:Uncharacterized protein n=1 Tax=marine sediment metagenome TaxID=412755 RepID=A0A0F8Z788_9ZZZZ
MADKEEITRLKIELAETLNALEWLMPEDKFYETFPDTLCYLEGVF